MELVSFLESIQELKREESPENISSEIVDLKKKLHLKIDPKRFIQTLSQLGIKIPQNEESNLNEDVWNNIKNAKEIPTHISAAFMIALNSAGAEIPSDPNELIHYGELIEKIVHGVAVLGLSVLEVVSLLE